MTEAAGRHPHHLPDRAGVAALAGVPLLVLWVLLSGCSDKAILLGTGAKPGDAAADATASTGAPSAPRDAGRDDAGRTDRDAASQADGEAICEILTWRLELDPVHLGFAFDVSGSMGKGDKPWHDAALKWEPVVAATRGFFESASSEGLSASLTFFPEEGGEDDRCVASAYTTPDVPMLALPSERFGEAIDAVTPASANDWRGGTPTVFVLRGTREFLEGHREQQPGHYAMVLVTDGYPQDCDEDSDTIEAVVEEMQVARDSDIDTYVVGVANPPLDGAPETGEGLEDFARAGGTDHPFVIDTGDPEGTIRDFSAAIEAIRETAVACEATFPTSNGSSRFDKERVIVQYVNEKGDERELTYDPSCKTPWAWHYDDPADPSQFQLCESTCDSVQSAEGELQVLLTCRRTVLL